ncbi:hypothetical protein HZZ13_10970 [Bradyrhizobium sp. CNPSo 4010]|uniref:Transposase n=1 Tax=Bradyrhizobium agreste TaxID=2751811 RepID=A0ABS0PMA3_9BRAD|nr:hypothetical protein [Bradyrhizobium agreste]MBH5398309.1 hypothetical protein [Bradyrhizobium agreste]
MIYAPNSTVDKQLVKHSRDLVRKAIALLRKSDHLVTEHRLRDERGEAQTMPPRHDERKSGQDR